MDSLVRQDDEFVAAGRLVCDQNSKWIIEFSRYLGSCTVIETELWNILDKLKLILDRGFEMVLIQIDSLEILTKVKQWRIQHIPREEITVVDSLVNKVRDRSPGLRLFKGPPLRV
ncbi:hypothetical protein J1N35_020717 [Gossypium stocksii]|uniref:RNase H type-1 domain-containing protein n=1 Tax=Gossypium stocksii TaxID=47602 RepID=A0A9D3VDP3_9ROSI|nr:hypothetical protein J1N35_020717 [Gossypium stocksii]